MYEKMYFKQDKSVGVKLPIKWMAIESIDDGIFSEKTDVVTTPLLYLLIWLVCIIQWSYGVTCWEIFTGGKVPYGGLTPMSLLKMLQEGYRMEKPNNAACSQKMQVTKIRTIFITTIIILLTLQSLLFGSSSSL